MGSKEVLPSPVRSEARGLLPAGSEEVGASPMGSQG